MPIARNSNRNQWCDYCKMQFSTKAIKGQTPADWVIIGAKRGTKRYLCQSCVLLCEEWNGEKYTIERQLQDAIGVEEITYGV